MVLSRCGQGTSLRWLKADCTAFPSGFFCYICLLNHDGLVDSLTHIKDCQRRYGGCCQCFDLYSGFIGGAHPTFDSNSALSLAQSKLNLDVGKRALLLSKVGC